MQYNHHGAAISVIVPSYNIREYLPRCLDSLLAQTHQELEIIVVDDGSTDGTGDVADAYAKKYPRTRVIHKENGGVTSARLRGVAEAQGDWIGFADGDDFCEPDMFERLLSNAVAHNAQISHCGYRMVYPSGKTEHYYNTGRKLIQEGPQGCCDLLDAAFVEPGLWNKLYRRELFVGVDTWMDKSIHINEDLLMNYYLFRQANTAIYEDFCPYHYLLRKGSASKAQLNAHQLKNPLTVLHILLQETQDHPQWHSIVEHRLIYHLVNAASMSTADQKELVLPFRREARKELRQRLPGVLSGGACSLKLKVMALWTAVWPWSYGFVHRVYAKVTGLDKKYSVE